MLKMTIDDENVVSNKDITIKEEMLGTSSTILNNVYPEEWEEDKDYVSRFYYPEDYSKLRIQNEVQTQEYEAGTTIQVNGSTTLTDVDTSKNSKVLRLLGQTSQTGTPTPSNPIPVNVVSGDNDIVVCGKNLFDKNNVIENKRLDSSGTYYNDNSYDTSDFIVVQPNTTYSFNAFTGSDCVCEYDINKTFIKRNIYNSQNKITTEANTYFVRVAIEKTKLDTYQFEKSSTITNYEAYNGNNYSIGLRTSKNMFDKSKALTYKWLNSSTGKLTDSSDPNVVTPIIKVEVGKTYTWSGFGSLGIRVFGFSSEIDNANTVYINMSTSERTFTATYPYVRAGIGGGNAIQYIDTIQLEEGNSATTFEAYNSIELCKIGNYQDYIYKDSDKWYKYGAIVKLQLTGSLAWYTSGNGKWWYTVDYQTRVPKANNGGILCSYFTKGAWNNTTDQNTANIICLGNDGNGLIGITTLSFTNLDDMKSFLNNNDVYVYAYRLNPTTTQITDTTLIEQLEALTSQ